MKKKLVCGLLCGVLMLGFITGCGKVEEKEQIENKENISNLEEAEKSKKGPFKYMICSGDMKLNKYDSAKKLNVEWTGEFDSSQNLIDFSGEYIMTFDKGVSTELIEKNKNLLEENYCNNVFSKEFKNCSVKIDDEKIIVNAQFDLKHIDNSELAAVKEDQESLYKLLPVHLEKIDNNKQCIGKN